MADVPLKSAYSRVFIIENRAGPNRTPEYLASLVPGGGASRGFGDVESIEVPSKYRFGEFEEVDEIVGASERPTTSLTGRYAAKVQSRLLNLARKRCTLDMQLHFGSCSDPSVFDNFDKIQIWEKARLSSYDTDDLGALTSGDNSPVNETGDITARDFYEVVQVSLGAKASSILTNEVVDVVICDTAQCGECEDPSDGCQKVFAITKSAGGSPSTPADVVFSRDKGVTWEAHDIDTLGAAEDPSGVDCLGGYLVVVSNASGSLHYADLDDFGVVDPAFTEVTTGFVAGGEPNDLTYADGMLFIVGDAGYIYKCESPADGVSVLDAGSVTSATLRRVHAISSDMAVAVGDNGTVLYTLNGTTWSKASASPVGYGVNLTAVWVRSEKVWIVGTSGGELYYTTDGGVTWTIKGFPGSGAGVVRDVYFSTESVGWLAHDTATPAGRILRSYSGGQQWKVIPEASGSSIPANDRVNRLAGCAFDANFIVGAGLADDGADGFLVVGVGAMSS